MVSPVCGSLKATQSAATPECHDYTESLDADLKSACEGMRYSSGRMAFVG
jgi:hypothetical protein